MENQITPEVKEKRSKRLLDLSDNMKEMYDKSYLGREVEVLVEETEEGYEKGHTKNYLTVFAKSEGEKRSGEIVPIRIEKVEKDKLIGVYINKKS